MAHKHFNQGVTLPPKSTLTVSGTWFSPCVIPRAAPACIHHSCPAFCAGAVEFVGWVRDGVRLWLLHGWWIAQDSASPHLPVLLLSAQPEWMAFFSCWHDKRRTGRRVGRRRWPLKEKNHEPVTSPPSCCRGGESFPCRGSPVISGSLLSRERPVKGFFAVVVGLHTSLISEVLEMSIFILCWKKTTVQGEVINFHLLCIWWSH